MKDREIFIKLYRGEQNLPECNKTTIRNTIKYIKEIDTCLKANMLPKTLARQSGLTEEEIKELPKEHEKVIKRLRKDLKETLDSSKVTEDKVYEKLIEHKEYVIRRLLDGDGKKNIATSLGVPSRTGAYKRFIADMKKEGYLVENVKDYQRVVMDIYNGKTFHEIAVKYPFFRRVADVEHFIKIHDIYIDPQDMKLGKVALI